MGVGAGPYMYYDVVVKKSLRSLSLLILMSSCYNLLLLFTILF